jgi:hypothetical protein
MYSLRTPCVLNFFECVAGVLRGQFERSSALLKQL